MALNQLSLERLWAQIIARLGKKVDKEYGKGLSSCDYTFEEKEKLATIEITSRADWSTTDANNATYIDNKPVGYELTQFCSWDGNTDNKTAYNFYSGCEHYKVSDRTDFSYETIVGSAITMDNGLGEKQKVILTQDNIFVSDDGRIINCLEACFLVKEPTVFDGIDIPAGVFFAVYNYASPPMFICSLDIKTQVIREDAISKDVARVDQIPCGTFRNTISWDGPIDATVSFPITDHLSAYKVSDRVCMPDDLLGQMITLSPGLSMTIDQDSFIDSDDNINSNGMFYIYQDDGDPLAAVVLDGELFSSSSGYSCPNGIYYVYYDSDYFAGELTLPDEVRKIDAKYLPRDIALVSEIPVYELPSVRLADSSTGKLYDLSIKDGELVIIRYNPIFELFNEHTGIVQPMSLSKQSNFTGAILDNSVVFSYTGTANTCGTLSTESPIDLSEYKYIVFDANITTQSNGNYALVFGAFDSKPAAGGVSSANAATYITPAVTTGRTLIKVDIGSITEAKYIVAQGMANATIYNIYLERE